MCRCTWHAWKEWNNRRHAHDRTRGWAWEQWPWVREKHSTAQHSTAQHSTAQHSTAQHSKGEQTRGGLCLLECLAHGPLCCARVCL
jgi:hypothetical protein